MKGIKMLIVLLMVLFFFILGLYALAPHVPVIPRQITQVSELNDYFNQLTESGNPPGLSVLVVKHDQVVYERSFGYADRPRQINTTSATVYHWWSMTKIPTAIAILQLQERGKLSLDDEVAKYLPWFEVQYISSESPAVTIRHLLQHSSGLPDPMPSMLGWVHYDDTLFDQTEQSKIYLPKFNKLQFVPGEKAAYSNLNYMVLGSVIEVVSGQTYEAYIMENILKPLGMTQTDFLYTKSMSGNEAAGSLPVVHLFTPLIPFLFDANLLIRERSGKILWLNKVYVDVTPPSGLIGPIGDVGRFVRMYLNRGSLEGKTILAPESIALLTNTVPIDGRGLGWYISESNNIRYVEHGGGGPGFATIMRLYPDMEMAIVVLANGTDLNRSGLADLLMQIDW